MNNTPRWTAMPCASVHHVCCCARARAGARRGGCQGRDQHVRCAAPRPHPAKNITLLPSQARSSRINPEHLPDSQVAACQLRSADAEGTAQRTCANSYCRADSLRDAHDGVDTDVSCADGTVAVADQRRARVRAQTRCHAARPVPHRRGGGGTAPGTSLHPRDAGPGSEAK